MLKYFSFFFNSSHTVLCLLISLAIFEVLEDRDCGIPIYILQDPEHTASLNKRMFKEYISCNLPLFRSDYLSLRYTNKVINSVSRLSSLQEYKVIAMRATNFSFSLL